uniref:reverse transcriptase domain-containing protein n=1 Tax=Chryseobacterium sp. RR2-3-20 TaxID=2787626 RepID=UPI001AE043E5
DLLVSFDVVSLFTQIPVEEAIETFEQERKLEPHIIELLKHCLKNTYFIYEGQQYKQLEGAPMGSRLSPPFANMFMTSFETKALDTAVEKPTLWLRYVDDTFVIWPHGEAKLYEFLNHLNSQHQRIQFTMEIEENNQLPFLDVLVIKKPNGRLGHTVYRKKIHTN